MKIQWIALMLITPFVAAGSSTDGEDDRWMDLGHGVLGDPSTGLQWTRDDNGADISWQAAGTYCARKHRGWRLPNVQELKGLYTQSGPGTPCGPWVCKVSTLFRLGGSWFWSATQVGEDGTDGNELAWGVLLVNGAQTPNVREADYGSRALCVRTP